MQRDRQEVEKNSPAKAELVQVSGDDGLVLGFDRLGLPC